MAFDVDPLMSRIEITAAFGLADQQQRREGAAGRDADAAGLARRGGW